MEIVKDEEKSPLQAKIDQLESARHMAWSQIAQLRDSIHGLNFAIQALKEQMPPPER